MSRPRYGAVAFVLLSATLSAYWWATGLEHTAEQLLTGFDALHLADFRQGTLYIENPDKCGQRLYKIESGNAESTVRQSRDDVEYFLYTLEFAWCVRLQDGRLVCPLWASTAPRFGWLGSVYRAKMLPSITRLVHESRIDVTVDMPMGTEITECYILIREHEDSGELRAWHFYEVDVEELSGLDRPYVKIPRIGDLPRIADDPLGRDLKRVVSRAIEQHNALLESLDSEKK